MSNVLDNNRVRTTDRRRGAPKASWEFGFELT